MDNPFAVFSPEGLAADVVVELFVENSPGVDSIQSDGHAMLVGPRGAGKSMLLRYMEPDCQRFSQTGGGVENSKTLALADIPYYAAYVTIRDTELDLLSTQDAGGLSTNIALNEHVLVVTIALRIMERASKNGHFGYDTISEVSFDSLHALFSMFNVEGPNFRRTDSERDVVKHIENWLHLEYDYTISYLHRVNSANSAFDRKLLRFSGFLSPLIASIKTLGSMPASRRFFLMIDDADRLSVTQTRILNTWLSKRNTEFSVKVSYEMYGYKTFYTSIDTRIEAPHDYQEIRVADIYTSNKKINYRDRMRQIIQRRLRRAKIFRPGSSNNITDVDAFFPEDHKQKLAIERLREVKRRDLQKDGSRSARDRDDLYRYVLPEYMSRLGGNSKNRSTYRYSGFDQLVDISSGVPRYFLEAAQKMYDRQLIRSSIGSVLQIAPEIQDSILRDQAQELVLDELEKLQNEPNAGGSRELATNLKNLINSLGAMFEKIMNDANASERRVFSFAISDEVSPEVDEVLKLGLRHAYFSRSSIGRKEGFGRTEKYVLSRRFAPFWNLDPSGFSAYKFLTTADLALMMTRPGIFRNRLRKGEFLEDGPQLELPIEE